MAFTEAPISAVITDQNGYALNLGAGSGPFTAAPLSIVVTDATGNAMSVGNGPVIVAKADAVAQVANIGQSVLYTVPANGGGMYRISAYLVVTRAATTSSTLPNLQISWTDTDSSGPEGAFNFTNALTGNVLGLQTAGGTGFLNTINAKAGTNINWLTANYASVGATTMQYAVHVKLEYLGA